MKRLLAGLALAAVIAILIFALFGPVLELAAARQVGEPHAELTAGLIAIVVGSAIAGAIFPLRRA